MQSIFPRGLDGSPGAIVASCARRVAMQVSSKHHWSLATRWSIMHKRARFGQQRALSSSGATRKSEPPITREDWCEPGVMSAINSAVYAPLRQFRPPPPPQIAWNSDCCSANSIAQAGFLFRLDSPPRRLTFHSGRPQIFNPFVSDTSAITSGLYSNFALFQIMRGERMSRFSSGNPVSADSSVGRRYFIQDISGKFLTFPL